MANNLYASGSATNAGIDYQQRVAAWFLVALLFNHDISSGLDLPEPSYIKEIAYETAESIDDLRLQLTNQNSIYLQIKRALSLSTSTNSDFYKTIKQFVKQFVLNKSSKDIFMLITSSDSSSKILRDLVKILGSTRLNDENYIQNPLSKSEHDTYEKYQQVAKDIFKEQTTRDMTPEEFTEFSKKVFIASFDIEEGKTLEKSVIIFLLDKTLISPELFWGLLIKNSLIYSSKRLSLNKEGLKEAVKKYLKGPGKNQIDIEEFDTPAFTSLIAETNIPSGKEVLLIKSFVDDFDYMIVELFRFNDDGSKKFEFFDDKCLLSDKTTVWTVLHRAATYKGMVRFLSENMSLLQGSRGFLDVPANDIEDVESTPHAQAYAELCQALFKRNKSPLTCLHCGKAVREKTNSIVEIDDNELEHLVGTVHNECCRPIDRVTGTIKSWFSEKYDFLKNFDGLTWSRAIIEGQSVFNNSRLFTSGDYYAWNPEYQDNKEEFYCIKVSLEDGSYRYIKQRGKVSRFSEQVAKEHAQFFNNSFEEGRERKDPLCYTSVHDTFGPYSILISKKDDNEVCLECLSAEPVRYSNLIGKIYNESKNFYAPLCLLVHSKTKEWITINSHIALLTDPLRLMDFIENWKKAGIEIDEYEIEIIEDDEEFDNKMREFFKAHLNVIVDPLIDQQKRFVKGIPVINYQERMRELQARHPLPGQNEPQQQDFIDIPAGVTFPYEFQGQILKVRILLRTTSDTLPPIGQEEYYTLPGSSEALFLADKVRTSFPAILVDEELDVFSILQVAEDIIVATGTGGMKTARNNPWIDLLSKASMVLISFPNNDAGQEASQWWVTHLPNAKIWPIPEKYRSINEMLMAKFDIRKWILSGLEEGSTR